MRPQPGMGFRVGPLLYAYLAGWTDEDAQIFSSFVTALGAEGGTWPQSAAVAVLLIWADDGLPERGYLR